MSGPFGSSPWGYNPGGSFYPYSINQSLRFDEGDSAYLTFTPSSNGTDNKKYTFSVWIKLAQGSGDFRTVFSSKNTGSGTGQGHNTYAFGTDDDFELYTQNGGANPTSPRLYRDRGAWYHFCIVYDTTQTTDTDRVKVYVNGTQQADYTGTFPTLNSVMASVNTNGQEQRWGRYVSAYTRYFNGYMAEIHMVDGQALSPTDFAEEIGGVWVPKEYADNGTTSHGVNGYHLNFAQDTLSGNSISFSGTSDRVQHADAAAYDIGASDDFTIEFFFKTSEVDTGNGHLMGNYATGGPHHLITYDFRNSSTRKINFYTGNGTTLTWDISGDVTVANNTWHHVVFQRDGTTLRAYIDGTRLTSVSGTSYTKSNGKVTNFNKDYNLAHIRLGNVYTTNPIIGSLSNVRYVIGNTVYADDDNDITVPTATLTAVTGTKLLTAVNATLGDDISTENIDATTSGSPVLSYDSPFTTSNFYDDVSGNGNNFTANGLAAHDVVPDSPSGNNFATLNPLAEDGVNIKTGAVLSEGNLVTATAGFGSGTPWGGGQSTIAIPTDKKIYCEMLCSNATGDSWAGGVSIPELNSNSTGVSNTGQIAAYNRSAMINGVETDYGSSAGLGGLGVSKLAVDDILQIAVDGATGKVWFGRNGTYFKSPSTNNSGTTGDPAAGTNEIGTVTNTDGKPLFIVIMGGSSTVHVNFGQDSSFAGRKTSGSAEAQDANGIGDFYYAPPTDYVCLAASSLSEPTIGPNAAKQADDYFNTVLYTGNETGQSISGVGFQPDFLWIKDRSTTNHHALFDAVRGAGSNGFLYLASSQTVGEVDVDHISSLDSDGFTLASGRAQTNNGSNTYVAWNWKAGGSASTIAADSISSGVPAIASSVSANTDAGFSIVGWTGTGSAITVGHGLGVTPSAIILKNRDGGDNADPDRWYVWHQSFSNTSRGFLWLNDTRAEGASSVIWNDTAPTSSVFSMGSAYSENGSNFIAYCFADVDSYLKCGSYVGNGQNSPDGTFVFTGFRPAFVMVKDITDTGSWIIIDNKRAEPYNIDTARLFADDSVAEAALNTNRYMELFSNGFRVHGNNASSLTNKWNENGDTFIYLAFAEAPFKFANAR